MFRAIVLLASLLSASAMVRTTRSSLRMSASGLVGSTAPLGFFDPLGLSNGKTDAEIKKIREAELKHGRVAMVAALGILTGEATNPFFEGKITGPAIYQFQQADDLLPWFWVAVLFTVGLVEGQNILEGWEKSPDKNGISSLREDYVNGDLKFDPLGLKPASAEDFDVMRTKELQNGRLAMIGVAGMVVQELVNGKGIVENLGL